MFISGYTAAFVYGRAMRERGVVVASARILKRAWQVYVAHIFLFVIYLAEIAYVSRSFENPLYAEEMGIFDFLRQPDVTLYEALLLKFKPANMDVLPLYIVLLTTFPLFLWVLLRQPTLALASLAPGLHRGAAVRHQPARIPGRNLGVQSVRMAIAVRVRRLVRDRRCGASCRLHALAGRAWAGCSLPAVRVRDRHDVVFPALRLPRTEMDVGLDVPDRQDQS